jgi:hypothetical protein
VPGLPSYRSGMSNSTAAAVLTTADRAEAIRAVRTLLGIAEGCPEVDFEAVIRSPEVLARVRRVLPGLDWRASAGKEHGSYDAGDDPADCLPIRVIDWGRPPDRAEPFVAALGPDPAAVRWDLDAWPAVPGAELPGTELPGTELPGTELPGTELEMVSQKYAYLTLTVNSRDLYQNELSQDHTVHVHVQDDSQTARVQWLAGQVGGRFTGRWEPAHL